MALGPACATSRPFLKPHPYRHFISMTGHHNFARRVFLVAGIYGVITLLPLYFMEATLGRDFPPPLTHPEQFYGFIGVALAWQFAFVLIAHHVQRYRLIMLPAVLEKLAFSTAVFVLYAQGRVAPLVAGAGVIDLLFAAFFVAAFHVSRSSGLESTRGPS